MNTLKNKIDAYSNKIIINPLDEKEIIKLEEKLKRKLPEFFRQFLLEVGIPQDLIIELHDSLNKFELLDDFLPNNEWMNYIYIGGPSEDYLLIKNKEFKSEEIYYYDYYKDFEVKTLGKSFLPFIY